MSLTMYCAKMCLRGTKINEDDFDGLLEFVATCTEVSNLIHLLEDNPFRMHESDYEEQLHAALLLRIAYLNKKQLSTIKNDFFQLCQRYEVSVPDSPDKALLKEALETLLDTTTHENCSDDIKYVLLFFGRCGEFPDELLPKMLELAERLSKEEESDTNSTS